MRLALPVLAVLALSSGCTPTRPAGVPPEAFHAGQGKARVWISVGEREPLGWKLRVYDRKGALLKEGSFRMQGMARAQVLPEEVVGWDGSALLLTDGGKLVPRP